MRARRSTRLRPPSAPAKPADDRWLVRAGPLRAAPLLLRELGVDAAALLAECRLPSDAFDDPEHWMPFPAAARLLQLGAQRTQRRDFGLLLAERCDPASLGAVAQNMQLAPTVGAALQVLRRDFHLQDRGAVPYVADAGEGCAALGYALSRHDTAGMAVVYDLAIGIGLKILRALCGHSFAARQVSFAHGAPADPRPWRRFFGAPVVFDAAHTQIEFDAAWLARPLSAAQAAARVHLQHAARAFDAQVRRSLAERAHSVAQALLMTGGLSEPRIAAELGLHARSLRRHLAAEGTSVRAIVNEVRDELGLQLLAETRLSLADIALALQYRDASAFSRAFKQRIGTAPGRWRAGPGR
jgi:AraC-like DNA-binding protein